MDKATNIDIIRNKLEEYRENTKSKSKKTMTVPEMRQLLGLGKTESYYLVHKGFFETDVIAGQMRINLDSFEKWYANQTRYKKITGEKPGRELCMTSYSFQDAASLLGIHNANLYAVWKKEGLETIMVDHVKRIPIAAFETWYKNQNKYRKVDKIPCITELEENYIPLYIAASLLGITKEKLSVLTRTEPFKEIFEMQIFENRKWISKKSFHQFLNIQEEYQIVEETAKQEWKGNRNEDARMYLSRTEAAQLANVSSGTITKWMQQHKFPCVGAGNVLRIRKKEFLEWIENQKEMM